MSIMSPVRLANTRISTAYYAQKIPQSLLQMNRLSLRNNWLKLETWGGLPNILDESREYLEWMKASKPEDVNM